MAGAKRVVGTVRHLWQAIEKEKTIKASCNGRDGTWQKRAKHLPELLAVPGILSAARYKAVKGGPKYLAFYELENVGVLRTSAFTDRPRTSWGQRVSPSVIGSSGRGSSESRSSRTA